MSQLTSAILTQIAFKRLSGKAMSSGKLSLSEEELGSTVQSSATTILGQVVPNSPELTDYLIQSASDGGPGTVQRVVFDLLAVEGTEYLNTSGTEVQAISGVTANTISPRQGFDAALGDVVNNVTDTYHAYTLKLPDNYQTVGGTSVGFATHASTPKSLGDAPFINSFNSTGSVQMQVVPEYLSTVIGSTNAYIPKLFATTGAEITPGSTIDWYFDAMAGVLFVADPPVDNTNPNSPPSNANQPGTLKAFLYVGQYQSEVVGGETVDLHFSASAGTGFSFANNATASFTSGSGEGLTVTAGATNNIEFELVGVLSSSQQIATEISGAINIATGSLSASIVGTEKEVEVTSTGPGNITIGLPDDVLIASSLTSSNLLITDTASITYFETTYNSSSIIYSSGSTKFGDTNDDRHDFTGSVGILYSATPTNEYGLKMSGSNFLIDYGNSGSATLGIHNVGFEFGSNFPITGSGLIISQSFTNEQTTHNMVKIGETELVDISGSIATDSFLINTRDKALVISSSTFNKPVAQIANPDGNSSGHILYNGITKALSITETDTQIKGNNVTIIVDGGANSLNMGGVVVNTNSAQATHIIASSDTPSSAAQQFKAYTLNTLYPALGGAVTASHVSSSGDLYAGLSEDTDGSSPNTVVYNPTSGLFEYTGSYGAADTTELEASASAGIFLSASEGTGFSIGLMQSASFTSGSGGGLTITAGDTNNIAFELVGVISGAAQIANEITGAFNNASASFAADILFATASIATNVANILLATQSIAYATTSIDVINTTINNFPTAISGAINIATGSLSASIVGTANEVGVTSTGPGNITIGLPDSIQTPQNFDAGTTNAGTITIGGNVNSTVSIGYTENTVNFLGSASIAGDLIVNGTTTTLNTQNLLVEDKYILLASGAAANTVGGGIVIQRGSTTSGTALHWDHAKQVWAVDIDGADASSAGPLVAQAAMVFASHSAGNPSGNPLVGGGSDANYKLGQMYVNTTDTDSDGNTIWIYAT